MDTIEYNNDTLKNKIKNRKMIFEKYRDFLKKKMIYKKIIKKYRDFLKNT